MADDSTHSEKAIDFRGDGVTPFENCLFAEYTLLSKMRCFAKFERIPYRMYFDEHQMQHGEWVPLKKRIDEFFKTKHSIVFKVSQPTAQKMTGCYQQVQNISFCYMSLLHQGVYHFYGFVQQRVDKPVTALGIAPTVWVTRPIINAVKYFQGEKAVDDFLTDYFENEFEKVNIAKVDAIVDYISRNTTAD